MNADMKEHVFVWLQKLRARGLVKRESPGVYAITEAGLTALEVK